MEDWDNAVDDFLTGARGSLEAKTVRYYAAQLRLLVRWVCGRDVRLAEFSARHWRQYLAYRAESVSQATRRHDQRCASVFFAFCAYNGYAAANPLSGLKLPRAPKPYVKMPAAEELGKLLAAIESVWDADTTPAARFRSPAQRAFYAARDAAVIKLLIETGARVGEVLALRQEDYRPKHPDGASLVIPQAKDNEPRVVPIGRRSVRAVNRYREMRGAWWQSRSRLLFVTWAGTPISVENFGRSFRGYLKAAGLSGFSLHGLKHYAATTLAETDLLAASAITGTSIETLRRHYLHRNPQHVRAKQEEADPLGKAMTR